MTAERPLPEGFRPLTLEDRDVLAPFLLASGRQSCEFAFANLFLWSGTYRPCWCFVVRSLMLPEVILAEPH